MFWVISVYFNIRNTLPKSGIFLMGQPVYIYRVSQEECALASLRHAYLDSSFLDLEDIKSISLRQSGTLAK